MAENSNPWTNLFGGSNLLNHSGQDVDPTTFSSKSGVMIYFSAHWCPPCRGFTPQLAQYYNSYKDKFNFELVFVSSDKDQKAFDDYWGEMPWLALPYSNRDRKNELSKKYKVQGIPTLVVLNSKGETITTGGRGKIGTDPEGFPWTPKTFSQVMAGTLIKGNNEQLNTDDILKSNTAVGIYFSAHWCPPCRGFTPKLVESYKTIRDSGKKFEIIFASSDSDEEGFKEYFAEMPWLAFPFKDKRITELNDLYEVEGIPMLVIVDTTTGKVITSEGREAIGGDPKGEEFPWHPKPLNSVENSGPTINSNPCLLFLQTNPDDTKATLNTVATSYVEKWKKEGKDQPLYFFIGSTTGDLAAKIRQFSNVNTDPALVILDIPGQKKYVQPLTGKPTEEDFRNFVDGYVSGTIAAKGIKE